MLKTKNTFSKVLLKLKGTLKPLGLFALTRNEQIKFLENKPTSLKVIIVLELIMNSELEFGKKIREKEKNLQIRFFTSLIFLIALLLVISNTIDKKSINEVKRMRLTKLDGYLTQINDLKKQKKMFDMTASFVTPHIEYMLKYSFKLRKLILYNPPVYVDELIALFSVFIENLKSARIYPMVHAHSYGEAGKIQNVFAEILSYLADHKHLNGLYDLISTGKHEHWSKLFVLPLSLIQKFYWVFPYWSWNKKGEERDELLMAFNGILFKADIKIQILFQLSLLESYLIFPHVSSTHKGELNRIFKFGRFLHCHDLSHAYIEPNYVIAYNFLWRYSFNLTMKKRKKLAAAINSDSCVPYLLDALHAKEQLCINFFRIDTPIFEFVSKSFPFSYFEKDYWLIIAKYNDWCGVSMSEFANNKLKQLKKEKRWENKRKNKPTIHDLKTEKNAEGKIIIYHTEINGVIKYYDSLHHFLSINDLFDAYHDAYFADYDYEPSDDS